jgi:hypothetical protein
MKKFYPILLSLLFSSLFSNAGSFKAPSRQYFELRVYHAADTMQVVTLEHFLQTAFVPALHRLGINKIGVFKAVANDTATDKKVYLLIPFSSLKEIETLRDKLNNDKEFNESGKAYLEATYDKPDYLRYETIVLRAFEKWPQVTVPQLTGPKSNRIYELRSYEGPTDKLYQNKVQMFNQGGETDIFKRLDFNAVFYGEVLFGSRMPNLMYMTSFENKAAREEHWKAFGNDPEWKQLSAMPEYQHNVSKAEITFLTPEEFSDL